MIELTKRGNAGRGGTPSTGKREMFECSSVRMFECSNESKRAPGVGHARYRAVTMLGVGARLVRGCYHAGRGARPVRGRAGRGGTPGTGEEEMFEC